MCAILIREYHHLPPDPMATSKENIILKYIYYKIKSMKSDHLETDLVA